MRLIACVTIAVGSALSAGTAAADLIPAPPPLPPAPTVTVPPLPVPTVPTTPPPPPPVVSQAVSTVTSAVSTAVPTSGLSSAPTAAVSSVTSSTSAPASSSSSSASAPSSSGSVSSSPRSVATASAGSSSSGPRADHFHTSRGWIGTTGPRQRRTTTFTFVLRGAARVVFTVDQVAPACVEIGHFSVAGRAGLNRVRFAGTVRGHRLAAGTYRISIRTASGHVVRRVTLVVVDGPAPSVAELRALRIANSCVGAGGASVGGASATTTSAPMGTSRVTAITPASQQGAAAAVVPPAPNLHGVLGSSVAKTARAVRPALVALLACAIVFLTLAALPREAVPDPRMHDLLARHRIEVAGLGVAALVAVALAFLLG